MVKSSSVLLNYIKFFYPGKKRVYLPIINSLDSQLGFYSLGLTGFFQSPIFQYRVKEDFKRKFPSTYSSDQSTGDIDFNNFSNAASIFVFTLKLSFI